MATAPGWLRAALCAVVAAGLFCASHPAAAQGASKPKPAKAKAKDGAKKKPAKDDKAHKKAGSKASPKPHAVAPVAAPLPVAVPVQKVLLGNGLRVVLGVDHAAPVVSAALSFGAGAALDERGRTGLAHVVERLLFEGSRDLGPGEHERLVASRGGRSTSVTGADRVQVVDALPASELPLAVWLEAQRLRAGVDVAALDAARQHLQLEGPVDPVERRVEELVYLGYFPYEHAARGEPADLAALDVSYVAARRAACFGVDGAVLAIAGDFDPDEAMRLVHEALDDAPRGACPAEPLGPRPEQTSQRAVTLAAAAGGGGRVAYAWAVPPIGDPDLPALEVLAELLGGGPASRVPLALGDEKASGGVRVALEPRRGAGLLRLDVALSDPGAASRVEHIVEGELAELAKRGPTESELARAQLGIQAAWARRLDDPASRAATLADTELLEGDARVLEQRSARWLSVRREDVARVASRYLGPTTRTLVELLPPPDKAAARPSAATHDGAAAPREAERPAATRKKGDSPHKPPGKGDAKKARDPRKPADAKKAPDGRSKRSP